MGTVSYLIQALGEFPAMMVMDISQGLSFLVWGFARSLNGMFLTLPFTLFSQGGMSVARSRLLSRASELGVGKGDAVALTQVMGAVMRIFTARIFLALYNSKTIGTPGAPFFFIGGLCFFQEILHQIARQARRSRGEKN